VHQYKDASADTGLNVDRRATTVHYIDAAAEVSYLKTLDAIENGKIQA